MKRLLIGFTALALLVAVWLPALAQESAVKGNLAGSVYDSTGAVVPGVKVTLTGPTGTRSVETDVRGDFMFSLLIPDFYTVSAEKAGFKKTEVRQIEVFTNRTSPVRLTLETGTVTEVVEVIAEAVTVDTASTAIGANLPDTLYQQIPIGRNVANIFYISPGVASGGGSGVANPSISGGSGLENLYVADGVNITDNAFGGLGTFSRNYGSLGTGINLSFVKEVQVKTGGFEPQYGKATGGLVQIVTKSGGTSYHGSISAHFQPEQFETDRKHPDDFGRFNLLGKTRHEDGYDLAGELGGYVPGLKGKLFFFGSINPSWTHEIGQAAQFVNGARLGELKLNTRGINYSGKLAFKINDKHSLESSVFGDPAMTENGQFLTFAVDDDSTAGKQEYGTRSFVARYNGIWTPSWLFNASFTWGYNKFDEIPFRPHAFNIVDRTQSGFDVTGALLPADVRASMRGIYTAQGYGFFEPTEGNTYGFNADTSKIVKFAGEHTFNLGYRLERPFYEGSRLRTGPTFAIPATNAEGEAADTELGIPTEWIGLPAQASLSLRLASAGCELCPLLNVPGLGLVPVHLRTDRFEVDPGSFKTEGTYHAGYVNDAWSPSKHVTMNLGVRWEQQRLQGETFAYTFTGSWSPRIGVTVDPMGDRRTKLFANFGRYTYGIPLDMAERSLTNELDLFLLRWAPDFTVDGSGNRIATINEFGGVNFIPDAAHLLNRVTGGTGGAAFPIGQSTTAIAPRTKLPYLDEFVAGFERDIGKGVILSARYIDRRYKRIAEDIAGLSPEAANAGITQSYVITNVNASTDLFVNEQPVKFDWANGRVISGDTSTGWPAECGDAALGQTLTPFYLGADIAAGVTPVLNSFGEVVAPGGVCFPRVGTGPGGTPLFGGEVFRDDIPDGFPNPIRNYRAVEIEVNKSFSENWQMRANWRIARLFGNFEGAFRNDNGQTDPSISSLFDFTEGTFGLLGDQFRPGHLNTDRLHVVNGYFSYVFPKGPRGLTLGTGVRVETGVPINRLKAHPAYLNSGEVPVGGRGSLGRLPITGSVDFHADYPVRLSENSRLRLGVDLFNIGNARRQTSIDEAEDSSFGTPNFDFQKPGAVSGRFGRRFSFQRPFYGRAMVKFEF
jgi:hypothetical protein